MNDQIEQLQGLLIQQCTNNKDDDDDKLKRPTDNETNQKNIKNNINYN